MRVGLVIAGVAATLPVMVLVMPVIGDIAGTLIATAGPAQNVFAVLTATAVAMLLLTLLGFPVPALLVLAGAILGIAFAEQRVAEAVLGAVLMVGLTALGLPIFAALLSLLGWLAIRWRLLDYWRPRDRLARMVALSAGLTAALAPFVCRVAFGIDDLPDWVPLAVGLPAGMGVYAIVRRRLAAAPFWVSNDIEGVDLAHRRVQIAGSFVLAFGFGGWQVLAIAVPAGLVLVVPGQMGVGGRVDVAVGDWVEILIPVTLGLLSGIVLLGHRTTRRLGERLTPLTDVRGVAVNLATICSLVAAGLAGLPMPGGQAAAGAVVGIGLGDGTTAWRARFAVMIMVWLLALPLGAGLALLFREIYGAALS